MVGMKAAFICPSTRFTWAMSCSALPAAMALKTAMKKNTSNLLVVYVLKRTKSLVGDWTVYSLRYRVRRSAEPLADGVHVIH